VVYKKGPNRWPGVAYVDRSRILFSSAPRPLQSDSGHCNILNSLMGSELLRTKFDASSRNPTFGANVDSAFPTPNFCEILHAQWLLFFKSALQRGCAFYNNTRDALPKCKPLRSRAKGRLAWHKPQRTPPILAIRVNSATFNSGRTDQERNGHWGCCRFFFLRPQDDGYKVPTARTVKLSLKKSLKTSIVGTVRHVSVEQTEPR